MTTPSCKKSGKPHTPYTSKAQTIAGNIALAAKEGKIPKSKLQGASKEMAKGMTLKELKGHSKEAKGKELPQYAKRSVRGSEPFSTSELTQGFRKLGKGLPIMNGLPQATDNRGEGQG